MSCCSREQDASKAADEAVFASVQDYYGRVLGSSSDLATSACTACRAPPRAIRQHIARVPQPVLDKFYGCGCPLPLGITGLHVLDLGSGSGRDCYVAAALVGPTGSVTGVDMTPEQLEVARAHAEQYTNDTLQYAHCNMRFVEGHIEFLQRAGVESDSVDLVISNCVLNLSPDKPRVLAEVFRVLKNGGEFHFSDVYCDRRLPAALRTHPVLLGECLGGALYVEDFKRICAAVGFTDPRVLECTPIEVHDEALRELLGLARFFSITFRLFKLPEGVLETKCEDYGQVAVYKGTLPGSAHAYTLDDHHVFETKKPALVCGNTAAMLQETWLAPHFTIVGDRSTHFGLFDCEDRGSAVAAAGAAGGGSCSAGGCC